MTIKYLDSKRISALSSDALVAHLKFNDNVTDSAGSNGGTVTGTTTYATGKIDKSFSFNGSSYITLANESNFDFERTDPFSIAFWVNMGNNTNKMLMCKGDDPYSAGTTSGISIWTQADWLDVNINASSSQFIRVRTAIASIEDSTWHHVTVAYDGSSAASGLTIYYDGVSQSLSTVSDTLTSSSILNNYPFLIGDSGAGSRDWTGKLDDLRIYSKELDQSEVTMIYNSGNGTEENKPTNVQDNSILVEKDTGRRYWFDEATAVTLSDDFSSDNWTDVGSNGVTGGHLQLNPFLNGTDNTTYRAITALSDTAFVMRFSFTPVYTGHSSGGSSKIVWFGLASGTGNSNATQDWAILGIEGWSTSEQKIGGYAINNGTAVSQFPSSSNFMSFTSGTTYYCQITRDVDDFTFNIYDDSAYSSQVGTVTRTVSSLYGLDTLVGVNWLVSGSNNATATNEIDNIEIYDGVTSATPATWTSDYSATRGVAMGGGQNSFSILMEYITIATLGNATNFGNLLVPRGRGCGVSSTTRGVSMCGAVSTGTGTTDIMEYITIATTGNATDFGDATQARTGVAGVSNLTRGVAFCGWADTGNSNVIDYITIATTGNALDFGDATVVQRYNSGTGNLTRGLFGGGYKSNATADIEYITIGTLGNGTTFGDLTVIRNQGSALGSFTRAVFCGGSTNTLDYVTIATLGNATDFGDTLSSPTTALGTVTSNIRGCMLGGHSLSNVIQYITIATPSNALDFGDLVAGNHEMMGVEA